MRVGTKHTEFSESTGGGFKFPENTRVKITSAIYKRRVEEARELQNGNKIPAKNDTVLELLGVVAGTEEEIKHLLGCGAKLWPSEDGSYLDDNGVAGTTLNRNTGAARFFASLVRVGESDGMYTEDDDAKRDENVTHLVGMEFQTYFATVSDPQKKIQDYTTLEASAIFVRPGGEEEGDDPILTEIAEAMKATITAAAKPISALALANTIAKDLSDPAKAKAPALLKDKGFIDQGVVEGYWKFDEKAKTFAKA